MNDSEETKDTDEEFEKWATSWEARKLHAETWGDIKRQELPSHRWWIKNLIPHGGFVIIAAVPGGYKSFISLEMARSICQGVDFLGQFEVQKGKVLIVDAENPRAEIQSRGNSLGLEENDDLHYLIKDDINLNSEDEADRLIRFIQDGGYNVVILDTFRAVGGSLREEKAEEVRAFFQRFKPLKDKGVGMVFLDHTRKAQAFEGKVPKRDFLLGSIDKAASVEVLLMLQSEHGSPEVGMYQRKNRLGKEIPPFRFAIRDTDGISFEYLGEISDELDKKEMAKELALNVLSDKQGLTTDEILSLTQKEVGQKNMRRALKELTDEGLLDFAKHGKKNYYFVPQIPEQPKEISLPEGEMAQNDSS